jgi:hypothetical protein
VATRASLLFSNAILATMATPKNEPEPKPDDSERARFARFAKKLVNVPKREIDEKAGEWRGRKPKRGRER